MQSYTTITIDGKEVGLKFGLFAMNRIIEKVDTTKGHYTDMDFARIIYAGYLNNALVKEVSPELTYEDIVDYVDDCSVRGKTDDIVKALNTFTESRIVKTTSELNKKKEPPVRTPTKGSRRK